MITRSLERVLKTGYSRTDVLWAFHEADEAAIGARYPQLLSKLTPGVDVGRVHFYRDVDCHTLFKKLAARVRRPEVIQSDDVPIVASDSKFVRSTSLSDQPPRVDVWVGRETELDKLAEALEPVVFVTGIGGQGKSALVAQYVKQCSGEYEAWDWRDCREEGDKLHSQLISIIERLTNGETKAEDIAAQNLNGVLQILFDVIEERRILFVFDNVDHYIDLETLEPSGDLALLVSAAERFTHKSQFVFTCRPDIRTESTQNYVINLPKGLSLAEAESLFQLRGVTSASEESIRWAHITTNGHPLWLNLLALQVSRRNASLDQLLAEIHKGRGELPEKTLRSVWGSVKQNEHLILRMMGEMIRAEPEDRIAEFLSGYMAWNKFHKAMKSLKALSLVVVKGAASGNDLYELHPLVRQFIRKEYPRREERERFILRLVNYFDKQIGKLRGTLQQQPSITLMENWLQKAELELNREQYSNAATTLWEVSDALLSRGYPEPFVRLSRKLFNAVEWEKLQTDFPNFHDLFNRFVETAIQLGDNESVGELMDKYRSTISGKSAEYINYCNHMAYWRWITGDCAEAIRWAEEGQGLKEKSSVDTSFDCAHNLALARRDSGKAMIAVEYFLSGENLNHVTAPGVVDEKRNGAYYGNIGRCLQIVGRLPEAKECYRKSLAALREETTSNRMINLGYGYLWLGEVLRDMGANKRESLIFLEYATRTWKKVMPAMLQRVYKAVAILDPKADDMAYVTELSDKAIEHIVRGYLVRST